MCEVYNLYPLCANREAVLARTDGCEERMSKNLKQWFQGELGYLLYIISCGYLFIFRGLRLSLVILPLIVISLGMVWSELAPYQKRYNLAFHDHI